MILNQELLESLLEEAYTRVTAPAIIERLYDPEFHQQTDFIKDPSKLKALFCTRRAAKSYTAGLYLVKEALESPGCNCLFIGLTRDSAKGIIWKDILKEIDRKNDLGIVFNETALTATLPNGSVIWVTGVDAEADEMNKLLGRKYKLAVVDEGSMYGIDLRLLIYGILKPAMADLEGTICIMGTASNITEGLFFDITTGKEAGWKLFTWTAHDNPHVARQWKAELDDIAKNRPAFMETALFKQWYLNQWVIDEDAKVYKFNRFRNLADRLPGDVLDWHHVLGLDLAHSPDSTAFVVGCYHESSPILFYRHVFKATKMDITDVAQKVKELDAIFHFEVKVVDGANKQAVAELNNRHGLSLIPADKTGKVDFITLMNDDMIQGSVKCLPGTEPLQEEWLKLVWQTDANGKVKEPKKENPLIHNDLSDGALYLWRYCYSYLFKPKEPFKDMTKQENWEPVHIERLIQQARQEQNPNELDLQWNENWDLQLDEENRF